MNRSDATPDHLRSAMAACASAGAPPNVALMHLILAAETEAELEAALACAATGEPDSDAAARIAAAAALLRANPAAFAIVKAVAAAAPHDASPASPDDAVRTWACVFDGLAASAPDAGVALYGLGSPALLARATAEVVEAMQGWGLIEPAGHVLEIGCGSGRFVAALAPLVASVTGLDVSEGMIAAARARCDGLANVRLARGSGRDLAGIPDESRDVVLAADVFPYLVAAGGGLAAHHVAEAARVLRPGGALLILNHSYRGDLDLDRRDLSAAYSASGLRPWRDGTRDLALWDAVAFLSRKDR